MGQAAGIEIFKGDIAVIGEQIANQGGFTALPWTDNGENRVLVGIVFYLRFKVPFNHWTIIKYNFRFVHPVG